MIYLGFLSDRIPIIPPFGPGPHICESYSYPYISTLIYQNRKAGSAGLLPFGRIFNLTRARKEIHKPILEWSDVKDLPSPTFVQSPPDSEREPLGCFSTRPDYDPRPNRVPEVVDHLQLDIAYSRVPTPSRLNASNNREDFLVFPNLAPYIFPRRPRPPPHGHFEFMEASPIGHKLPPDEQITCFDYLYYITSSSQVAFEWERSWSPPWVQVGKYLRFTDDLVEIVEGYLRRVFESSDGIPPVRFYRNCSLPLVSLFINWLPSFWQFIAVHIRRGDFGRNCDGSNNCYISLATFRKKVDDMKAALLETKGVDIKKIILMSGMFRPPSSAQFSGSYQMHKRRTGPKVLGRSQRTRMGALQPRRGRHSGEIRRMVSSYC
jgi:hypothetical protein